MATNSFPPPFGSAETAGTFMPLVHGAVLGPTVYGGSAAWGGEASSPDMNVGPNTAPRKCP